MPITNLRNNAGSSNSSVTANGTICCDQSSQARQILFRRHQRQPIALGLGDQAFDLAFRIRMMIGEGALPGHFDAAGAQRVEESRGIADAGERQHALAPELGDLRRIGLQMRRQHRLALRCDLGCHRFGSAAVADDDQRVGARQLRPQRRAQGTGGKYLPIAEPALAVDHDQRRILDDRRALEAVVHQDHGRALRARQRHAVGALARHHHRQRCPPASRARRRHRKPRA